MSTFKLQFGVLLHWRGSTSCLPFEGRWVAEGDSEGWFVPASQLFQPFHPSVGCVDSSPQGEPCVLPRVTSIATATALTPPTSFPTIMGRIISGANPAVKPM